MSQPIRLNYEAREVRLPEGLADGDVVFVAATVFDEPPVPFAIVNYKLAGKLQKKGLRMDLDKRVFLDHFDDAAFEQSLAALGIPVATAIGKARSESSPVHAARA